MVSGTAPNDDITAMNKWELACKSPNYGHEQVGTCLQVAPSFGDPITRSQAETHPTKACCLLVRCLGAKGASYRCPREPRRWHRLSELLAVVETVTRSKRLALPPRGV